MDKETLTKLIDQVVKNRDNIQKQIRKANAAGTKDPELELEVEYSTKDL